MMGGTAVGVAGLANHAASCLWRDAGSFEGHHPPVHTVPGSALSAAQRAFSLAAFCSYLLQLVGDDIGFGILVFVRA